MQNAPAVQIILILYSNNLVICPEMRRFYLLQGIYNIIKCFGLLLDINTYFGIGTYFNK